MATFQTASLLNIIEQGQKMESVFVGVLLETAMKLASITNSNILVVVDTAQGRKWAGRCALKEEFVDGRLRLNPRDEEIVVEGYTDVTTATLTSDFIGDITLAASQLSDNTAKSPLNKFASSRLAAMGENQSKVSTQSQHPPLMVRTTPTLDDMGLHSPVSSAPGAAIQSNTPSSPHSDAFKEHPSGSVQTNSTVQSGNVVGISTGHKLVGSQKRKRRVSVTSASHEKKSRNGSGAESEKSKSDLQQSEEGEGASNAKQYLDKLARKYVSGFEGMTTNDSPQSDGEVSDIFNDGQNNNNEKGTFNSYPSIVSPMFQRKEYVPRPLQKGRMSPKFMGPSIYRQSSTPQPEEEANVPVSTSSPPPPLQLANMEGASPLGNNKMYQDQIRHMLSAKMSVEEIAVQLKLPPSIIVYYVSLMGIPIKTEEEEKALLPYKAKEEEPGAGRRSGKLDKKSLKQLIDSNKSIREIADILGVHPTTVYRAMKAYDLSLPGHNQASTLADKHLNTPRPSYSNMEEFAGPSGEKTMPQPPTGQRVRLKRDRLHLLKNLIMGGATVRECANILGVHHTTIYRAMRNLNMDGTQPHKSLQANTSQSSSTSGHADLPASSLLHHLPFADANNLRRWSDPAAAASGYLGLASSFPNSFPEGFPETLKHTTSPSFEQEDKKEANEEDEDEEFEGTPQNYSQQFRDLQEELGHEEEVEDDDDDEENAKDITSFDA